MKDEVGAQIAGSIANAELFGERQRVREVLRESEQPYRALAESSQDFIFIVNKDGCVGYVNKFGAEEFGCRQEEMFGKRVEELFPPEISKRQGQNIRKVFEHGRALTLEHQTVFPRRELWLDTRLIPLRNETGEVYSVLGVSRDITERKRVEETLRASEEKYRNLVENATEAIFIVQDEKIKFPNPRTLSLSGYSAEELSKIPITQLLHPDEREAVLDRYRRRMRGEEIPGIQTYRVLNKANEELWAQFNSVPITWEGRPATLNFVRDMTREKKLEAQFQTAQKMEAVGTLAGGIAHDFNNLLMGIQGVVSLMLFDLDPSHPHYESLKKIEAQVKNGANLSGQLLAFAQRGRVEVKPSDVNKIIRQTSNMFQRTKREINIRRKYQEGIWAIEVDRGQIEQVLMNLYVNAWQAMPEGGTLYLESRNVILDRDSVMPSSAAPGKYVRISVRDTGIGMDKKTQQRIFDPFFTTKEMGRGTGLGLASVYGIIKNHGGFIDVYSEIGQGTTFNLYLPASDKPVPEEKRLSGEILNGTEMVLLVDDEETITEIMEKALTLTGYKVMLARGGEEAIDLYKKNQNRIDLVVLDMIMPGMNGGKVFDRLREMNPGLKVILSSGYSIDGEASQIMARGCNGFIQKPFGIKELSQKIREVLGKQ